ncbi:hypothetical protein A9B99_13700 [Mangrovibacter phragmitis]|uniref:Fimbrial protein n=1 Tax=Mangrovibacter phragmitis TaxID=1691903 RepID=A0A1B7L0G2_9ENTR|nr:CS1 type fimbrial major subunit [Mangrovibacter phragmitis]OAT75860.1 hypothetical protein A9B99_13700 [Mangrovibacter phragmitis]
MKKLLVTSLACTLAVAFSASALQKDITVTAAVDANLEMTLADGSALPTTVAMQHMPGLGLSPHTLQTRLFSNAPESNVIVRLVASPELTAAESNASVPLSVTLGNKTLSTSDTVFNTTDLYPGGDSSTGSMPLPLVISQASSGSLTSGHYNGLVSMYMTLSAD